MVSWQNNPLQLHMCQMWLSMITARVSKSLFITRRYKGLDLILNSLSLALADFKNSAQFEWDYQTYQDDITMSVGFETLGEKKINETN